MKNTKQQKPGIDSDDDSTDYTIHSENNSQDQSNFPTAISKL